VCFTTIATIAVRRAVWTTAWVAGTDHFPHTGAVVFKHPRVPGARPLNAGHPGFPTSCSSPPDQMWLVVPAALRFPFEPGASFAHDSA
jgi:hypothetical protein